MNPQEMLQQVPLSEFDAWLAPAELALTDPPSSPAYAAAAKSLAASLGPAGTDLWEKVRELFCRFFCRNQQGWEWISKLLAKGLSALIAWLAGKIGAVLDDASQERIAEIVALLLRWVRDLGCAAVCNQPG